jgi:hypothetical protein
MPSLSVPADIFGIILGVITLLDLLRRARFYLPATRAKALRSELHEAARVHAQARSRPAYTLYIAWHQYRRRLSG